MELNKGDKVVLRDEYGKEYQDSIRKLHAEVGLPPSDPAKEAEPGKVYVVESVWEVPSPCSESNHAETWLSLEGVNNSFAAKLFKKSPQD